MPTELKEYCLVHFDRETGEILKAMEALGKALLNAWAIQNITKNTDIIVFDKENGDVDRYYEGNGVFPDITKYPEAGNIEDYAPGLLEYMQNESEVD